MLEHERWDRVFCGVPWQLRPDQRNLVRLVVLEAEAEQGVALVVVMLVVPRVDRRRYVKKRDLVKYGYTDECQACTQLASGMHNPKVPHDDRCRDRIGELMADDDNQRGVCVVWVCVCVCGWCFWFVFFLGERLCFFFLCVCVCVFFWVCVCVFGESEGGVFFGLVFF